MGGMDLRCHAWRHPRPRGVAGRCIGRTDVAVDPRKARRLARRIHREALREVAHGQAAPGLIAPGLIAPGQAAPRVVCCSPLRRCLWMTLSNCAAS